MKSKKKNWPKNLPDEYNGKPIQITEALGSVIHGGEKEVRPHTVIHENPNDRIKLLPAEEQRAVEVNNI